MLLAPRPPPIPFTLGPQGTGAATASPLPPPLASAKPGPWASAPAAPQAPAATSTAPHAAPTASIPTTNKSAAMLLKERMMSGEPLELPRAAHQGTSTP